MNGSLGMSEGDIKRVTEGMSTLATGRCKVSPDLAVDMVRKMFLKSGSGGDG